MAELYTATEESSFSDGDMLAGRRAGALNTGLRKFTLVKLALYFTTKIFGSMTGQQGKVPTVNATEDGFIWGSGGGGGGGGSVAFKGCAVTKAANQTTANYTSATAIAWDKELYDTSGFHDNVTNNSRLTVPAGVTKVRLVASAHLASVANGDASTLRISKNGGVDNWDGAASVALDSNNATRRMGCQTPPIDVVPGDYFEASLIQSSDNSLTVTAQTSFFSIEAVETSPVQSGCIHVREEQASGTGAGNASTSWTTRVLNTVVKNSVGASLASNQITLPPGTYNINANVPCAGATTGYKCRLQDITNGVTLLVGNSIRSTAADAKICMLVGQFTLTTTTVVAVQMIASAATANGLGAAAGITGENNVYTDVFIEVAGVASNAVMENLTIAISDETTALTTGTGKFTFRMPYGFKVTGVKASLGTAQATGSIFTVDINEGGASILSTKLTIDNTEKTSKTAATLPVLSDTDLADDAEITVDIDQIGDGTAKGLKVYLIGYKN